MYHRLPVVLTPSELESLLLAPRTVADAARSPVKQLAARRDFVMVQTGTLAGPRVEELCSLDVQDVDPDRLIISIRRGKGDRDRNILINKKLFVALSQWIGERKQGFVFQGDRGGKLGVRTFQERLVVLMTSGDSAAEGSPSRPAPHLRYYVAQEGRQPARDSAAPRPLIRGDN